LFLLSGNVNVIHSPGLMDDFTFPGGTPHRWPAEAFSRQSRKRSVRPAGTSLQERQLVGLQANFERTHSEFRNTDRLTAFAHRE